MSQIEQIEGCPMSNFCPVTSPDAAAPECGTVSQHMSPLTVAEGGCLRAFQAVQERANASPEELRVSPLHQLTIRAYSTLELAMAQQSDQLAVEGFAEAAALTQQALEETNGGFHDAMPAALLDLYLPQFRARRFSEQLSMDDERHRLASGLADIHAAVQAAPIHHLGRQHYAEPNHSPCFMEEGVRIGYETKLFVPLLALRKGRLLFPASPREQKRNRPWIESTSSESGQPRHDQRHDWYELVGEHAKVPLKTGWRKNKKAGFNTKDVAVYGDGVLNIYVLPLLYRSMQTVRSQYPGAWFIMTSSESPDEYISKILSLPAREARGEQLRAHEKIFIDDLTTKVLRRLSAHCQSLAKDRRKQ